MMGCPNHSLPIPYVPPLSPRHNNNVIGYGAKYHSMYTPNPRHPHLKSQAWAVRMGLETPALFADPVYTNFKDIRLSTSTLASPALQSGGFGPVSQTSYGVGYGIQEDGSQFSVMSYGLGCDRFCETIEGALTDMRSAIDSSTA